MNQRTVGYSQHRGNKRFPALAGLLVLLTHAQVRPGLSHFRRSKLDWLNVVDRVRFWVCVQVFDVCTTWLLDTCPLSANPSPAFLDAATCDQLTAVTWTSLASDWLHTAARTCICLRRPIKLHETHFLPNSATIVFLSQNFHTPP